MNAVEGRGVRHLLSLLGGFGRRLKREKARPYVDGLSDAELGDILAARAAAVLAKDGAGDLFLESAAARLHGIDVASHGSAPKFNRHTKERG